MTDKDVAVPCCKHLNLGLWRMYRLRILWILQVSAWGTVKGSGALFLSEWQQSQQSELAFSNTGYAANWDKTSFEFVEKVIYVSGWICFKKEYKAGMWGGIQVISFRQAPRAVVYWLAHNIVKTSTYKVLLSHSHVLFYILLLTNHAKRVVAWVLVYKQVLTWTNKHDRMNTETYSWLSALLSPFPLPPWVSKSETGGRMTEDWRAAW